MKENTTVEITTEENPVEDLDTTSFDTIEEVPNWDTEDTEYEEDYAALAGVAGVSYVAGILTDHVWKIYIKPRITPVIANGKAKLVAVLTKSEKEVPEKEITEEVIEAMEPEIVRKDGSEVDDEAAEAAIKKKVDELKKKNKK